ncbi:AAA family ATPase [Hathewaya limosa]|uniref:Nuclease SbcCD subunit C n=1 Tax=Hathewaya limosa TaxID=1536 RepID=A0ABU0JRH4_HATLI|nr:AAA family ATPase [Hathewaya limosa]MDQ0478856.1 DNA repair exonuclease SbcCD ATPase subunit [Hathewaya limosa]
MSKIEKVKLLNFRVFRDKFNQVDFNNENGLPADFVCIYGQNGMGKTSFFDGIEWFTSGVIYRFEDKDIKKEIRKYKGYVLSNRNIDRNNEKSYIEVKYSDNYAVKRTVIRANKDINEKGYRDYNKGRLNTNNFKMNIMDKQILPHNKIDSFIYANSPSEKYEEWGNFWDSDGSQRKLFTKVYRVKKLIAKRIDSLQKVCEEDIEELKKLTVSDEKIKEINNKINEFNTTEPMCGVKLKEVIKKENEIINIPDRSEIREYKNSVNKMIDIENLNRDKLIYLLHFYKDNYTQKEVDLNNKIKKIRDQLNKYKELNGAGDIWFEEYNQWKQLSSDLKLINQQLKFKVASLDTKNKDLDNINEQIKKWETSLKYLEVKENYFLSKAKGIEKIIKEISDNKYREKVNNDILEKLYILKKQNQNKISNLEEAKLKNNKEDFDIHVTSVSEDDKKFLDLKKIYIDKYKNLENEIKNKSETANKEKDLYISYKKNFDEIQNVLIQVKGYIEKENLNNCPVCHTPFKNVELLLSKINLDEQSSNCKKLYDNYQLRLLEKEKALNEKKELVTKWNEECEKYKASIGKINSHIAAKITNITNQNKKLEESIKLEDVKVNEFKGELSKISQYEEDFSEASIKEWLNIIKTTYKGKLDESTKEKDKISKLIISLDKETKDFKLKVKELEDKNDDFNKKNINKVLVSKLDEMNTSKNFQIKEWKCFEIYYNSLIMQNQELEKESKDINNYIKEYESNDDKNSFREENLEYTQNSYRDYMLQIFKKNYIDFSDLISLSNKKDDIIKNLKVKIDILDYINNELCSSDYNIKYTELSRDIAIKERELKKYKPCKEKIDYIFSILKKYIEENIENVLGSKSMNQIYSVIEPNKEFKKLKIEVMFTNNGNKDDEDVPELYLESDGDDETILPEYFFSTAQLNTVALSIFLGQALSMDLEVKTIFIDDPVGHFDDINVLAFVDLLRNIIKDGKWQIVISTHDESFYNLLKNKISDEYYNSKFITFSSIGKLY